MRIDAGSISAIDQTTLEPASSGTDATFSETLTSHTRGASFTLLVFGPVIRIVLGRTYRNLKQALEAEGAVAPAGS